MSDKRFSELPSGGTPLPTDILPISRQKDDGTWESMTVPVSELSASSGLGAGQIIDATTATPGRYVLLADATLKSGPADDHIDEVTCATLDVFSKGYARLSAVVHIDDGHMGIAEWVLMPGPVVHFSGDFYWFLTAKTPQTVTALKTIADATRDYVMGEFDRIGRTQTGVDI